ncbi:hypothetical protein HKX48_004968 [Thoreauomyces humboldtii]|nr:hypothetical protein HKX48_004968 [Thoreauomyces humboldtii]
MLSSIMQRKKAPLKQQASTGAVLADAMESADPLPKTAQSFEVSEKRGMDKHRSVGVFHPQPLTAQQQTDKKLGELVRDLPIFVLIYLAQWLPYLLYALLLVAGKDYAVLDVIVVTLTNSGGIANALAYRRFMLHDAKKTSGQSTSSHPSKTKNASSTSGAVSNAGMLADDE